MRNGKIQILISSLIKREKSPVKGVFQTDYKQSVLSAVGREQFISLIKKGLNVPVVML